MRKMIVTNQVIRLLKEQVENRNVEMGGLLYGKLNPGWIRIENIGISGPHSKQTPDYISLDMDFVRKESMAKAQEQMLAVGTWHSRPPGALLKPSALDTKMMNIFSSYYKKPMLPVFCICSYTNKSFSLVWYEVSSLGLPKEVSVSCYEEKPIC
ncbi:hypothetical protein KB449_00850 [Cohnella sp. F6_2S_P_1]|uniref:JAB1/MPN/MOV34 metalloenzyme domain-containing protein n=2 Tax=Cohnella hashimotonis TaxID=2826895 RepID=A0ABT6T9I0_9BACL|nr:hypothetical protein [Cohnella hashimotonis]MDI4643481.1 hypothetical protein [Cohnella hashimotonis]